MENSLPPFDDELDDDNQETTPAPKKRKSPWVGDVVAAMGCCALGLLLYGFYLNVSWIEALWVAAALYLLGSVFLVRASRRWYGESVERKFVARLFKRAPADWLMQASVPVAGLGDADVVVAINGVSYALEIKSQSAIKYENPFVGREKLVDGRGRALQRDPVAQVRAVATRLGARPVLWFPRARLVKEVRMRCGVFLVTGNEKQLIRAMERHVQRTK